MNDRQNRIGAVSTGVLLLAFSALACALRVALGYRVVLGQEDVVIFLETDAWYHMRLVDSLVQNFPYRIWFDPYLLHPGGQFTQVAPMLDWLIAGIALLLGGGRPFPLLVDLVGAYTPPVIGALTTLPVYFLGRELFSRRAGLFGAAIIGLLPGDILLRSLLGFTDHHCLETLLSAVTLSLMVFALNPELPRRRRIVYTVLSGVGLGAYLLTWSGGIFLVAVLCVWGLGYVAFERLRNADAIEVIGVLMTSFGIAAFMILPWVETSRSFAREAVGLAFGLIAVPLLWAIGRIAHNRAAFLSAMLLAATAGILTVRLLSGSVLTTALPEMQQMSPWRVQTVAESIPLFKTPHRYPLWRQFTTSFYLALLALRVLLPDLLRRATARHTLWLTWTATTVVATIDQVRFSYYLAVNVALLAGAGCDLLLSWFGTIRRTGPDAGARGWMPTRLPGLSLRASLGSALLVLVIVGPSVPYFRQLVAVRILSPEHLDAFAWMRDNTPDPFDDTDSYYKVFRPATHGRPSPPVAAYGVMASWSRGHPMIRLARRVPNANGNQAGSRDMAAFLLAQDEDEANEILTRLNTRYVITDWLTAERRTGERAVPSEFASFALDVDRNPRDYREEFYRRDSSGQLRPLVLYYPSYYRSMASRLQSFGGADVTPVNSTWVISFSDRLQAGKSIKEIQTERLFSQYEDAVAFVASTKSDRFRIVGYDPLVSCVPLRALREYAPTYHSVTQIAAGDGPGPPRVRIFEYRRWKPQRHS